MPTDTILESGGKRKLVSPQPASNIDARQKRQRGGKGVTVQDTGILPQPKPQNVATADRPKGAMCSEFAMQYGDKFSGKLINDLIFVEICAGSARLTRTARQAGFKGIAIDHTDKRASGIDICIFELEDQDQVNDLCAFLESESENIAAVWIAPSCGTASKARERRLPQLARFGIQVPVPLRSREQPDQLDGLSDTDKIKVERANMLYSAVEQITRTTCRAGIFTGIENPANSHYWETTPMQNIIQEFGAKFVTFHNCSHGGSRDKLTSIWVNDNWLDALEARCDNTHSHKSWKVTVNKHAIHFPTSEEAAYPFVLCERIVECVRQKVTQMGALASTTLAEQVQQPDADSAGRIALGALPRGTKVRPLVAEFGHFVAAIAPLQQPNAVETFVSSLPKGSKITSRQVRKRGELRVVNEEHTFLAGSNDTKDDDMVEMCWIGVPSSPEQFVQRAQLAGHPRGLDVHVDGDMQQVVRQNLVDPPYMLAKKRVQYMKRWTARAKELAEQERQLREGMPEHVRNVVGQKRLLLMGEMLAELGYPDAKLTQDIAEGFRLSGYMTRSNVFRARSKRPAMSLDTLRKLGKSFNSKNLAALGKRQEPELEDATWGETQVELDKGWVFLDESGELGEKFLGRRFGIKQGAKVRVIDDCTCCGLNLTVGLHEKFKLHSVDFLAAMLGFALKFCPSDGRPKVRGRTYDLRSAYKQFAVHPDDRAALRMGVNVPGKEQCAIIGFNSLPFGAIGSVAGFLRVSQAVWFLGYFGLGLLWSAFYDDYTLLSRCELESSSSWACEALFDLLGLAYAQEGHKCKPFDTRFKTLGLEVDTEFFQQGHVLVGHTESRREELHGQLAAALEAGTMSAKEAERMRGRMIFFEGYAFGRVANSAVKALGRLCNSPEPVAKFSPTMRTTLEFLQKRVLQGRPLKIQGSLNETWLVFTDGACEPEAREGSVGGVIFDPHGNCLQFFGERVPDKFMNDLLGRSKNPIHELEVLPILIAVELWGQLYAEAQVVYYIDNESSRMAYVRGDGETQRAAQAIEAFVQRESAMQHRVWFGRVPSYSNIADGPSRLDFEEVQRLGATKTSVNWELVAKHLCL